MEEFHEASDMLEPAKRELYSSLGEAPSAAGLPDVEAPGNPGYISYLTPEEALWISHPTS